MEALGLSNSHCDRESASYDERNCMWSALALPRDGVGFVKPSARVTSEHILLSVLLSGGVYLTIFFLIWGWRKWGDKCIAPLESLLPKSDDESPPKKGAALLPDSAPKKLPCLYQQTDVYFSTVYYPVLSVLAFHATIVLAKEGVEGRWHRVLFSSYWFSILYIGGNLAHVPVTLLKEQTFTYKCQMIAHHTLSIVCFIRTSYAGIGHFYVALDGCCELCTWLLNNVFLLKELGLDKIQWLFALNGVLLWLSYVFFRLILFPVWLFMYFKDILQHPTITVKNLTVLEQVLFPTTNIVLLVLSTIWFIPISKGMFKAVSGKGDPLQDAPTTLESTKGKGCLPRSPRKSLEKNGAHID